MSAQLGGVWDARTPCNDSESSQLGWSLGKGGSETGGRGEEMKERGGEGWLRDGAEMMRGELGERCDLVSGRRYFNMSQVQNVTAQEYISFFKSHLFFQAFPLSGSGFPVSKTRRGDQQHPRGQPWVLCPYCVWACAYRIQVDVISRTSSRNVFGSPEKDMGF